MGFDRVEFLSRTQFRIPASSVAVDPTAIIHFEAIELLGESFSSSRKKNRPLPRILRCMHRAPYQEHTELCSYSLLRTIIA
ncbi:hypothetical protein Lal_00009349 [Lupinus albus]|nr:hypothetical protein Lal_00009349 [Lupinus albus]